MNESFANEKHTVLGVRHTTRVFLIWHVRASASVITRLPHQVRFSGSLFK